LFLHKRRTAMAPGLRFFFLPLLASTAISSAQPLHVSSSYNLVLIFVDLKDGRKPDGSLPGTDEDLKYFNDTTINAVEGRVYAEATGASATSLVLQGAELYLSPGSSSSAALNASDSKIHLLEDARCAVTRRCTLNGAVQISGSGTFSVNPGSSLIVGPTGRVDVGKEIGMTLAPGMKLLLDPGAVVNVEGELSAPDSIARRMKRAK
jgi:hypothetical protein